ncbi:MAG: hypothetical protein QOI92_2531 [Chloroflexota bacterium]|jgi:hypothetical protein|nr:hypothetical protein [Chloroflexota bacterium]
MPRRPEIGDAPRRIGAPGLEVLRPAIEPEHLGFEAAHEPIELADDVEAMSATPPASPSAPAPGPVDLPASAAAPLAERPSHPRAVPMRPAARVAAPGAMPMRMAGPPMAALSARSPVPPGPMRPAADGDDGQLERTATAPQLRRFIKSRAYVPMHELRRRFGINGGDDEVTPVDLERTRVFVGLPDREGRLLGDLLRGGDIGYELSLDPISPIVVGVYPMRPVTRS